DAESCEHRLVERGVREVVLLLQTFVALDLRRARSERSQPLFGDRGRDDDARRRPAAESVLQACELVVEGVRRWDAERAPGQRELVGGMGEGDVEAASPGEAAQRAQPTSHCLGLSGRTRAAVSRADDLVLDPRHREQLDRLRVLARRYLD